MRTDLGGPFTITNLNGKQFLLDDVRVFNEDPNWRVKVLQGTDATLPYTRQVFQRVRGVKGSLEGYGSFTNGAKFNSQVQVSYLYTDGPSSIPSDATLRDIALARLKRKISSHTKSVNLLVPLAELHELRGLVKGVAFTLVKLVRAILHAKKTKSPRAAFRYAADQWLQFSFAVGPTLGDISSISDAIATFLNDDAHAVRLTGTASKQWTTGSVTSIQGGLYGATTTRGNNISHELSYRYTAGILVDVKAGNNYGLGSQFGLEFGALVPTLWELTIFSWIADYFGTVGAYLEDTFQSSATSTTFVTLNKRYTYKETEAWSYRQAPTFNTSIIGGVKPGILQVLYLDRTKLSSLPTRALRFKTADEIGINAVSRLLNLASLLIK